MTVGSIAIRSEPWIQGGVVEIVFGDECFVKNEEMNKNNIMKIASIHTHTHKKIMAGSLGSFSSLQKGMATHFLGRSTSFFPVLTDSKGHYLQSQERDWEGMEDGGGWGDKGDPDWRNMTWDLS